MTLLVLYSIVLSVLYDRDKEETVLTRRRQKDTEGHNADRQKQRQRHTRKDPINSSCVVMTPLTFLH